MSQLAVSGNMVAVGNVQDRLPQEAGWTRTQPVIEFLYQDFAYPIDDRIENSELAAAAHALAYNIVMRDTEKCVKIISHKSNACE